MLYIIFSREAYDDIAAQLASEQASLWVNPSLLDAQEQQALQAAGVMVTPLPQEVDASDQHAVLAALEHVEKNSSDADIFIEYL